MGIALRMTIRLDQRGEQKSTCSAQIRSTHANVLEAISAKGVDCSSVRYAHDRGRAKI